MRRGSLKKRMSVRYRKAFGEVQDDVAPATSSVEIQEASDSRADTLSEIDIGMLSGESVFVGLMDNLAVTAMVMGNPLS